MATVPVTMTPEVRYQPLTSEGWPQQRYGPVPQGIVEINGEVTVPALGAGDETYLAASVSLNSKFCYQFIDTSLSLFTAVPGSITFSDQGRLSWSTVRGISAQTWYTTLQGNGTDVLFSVDQRSGKFYQPRQVPTGILYNSVDQVVSINWDLWDVTPTSIALTAQLQASLFFYPWSQRYAAAIHQPSRIAPAPQGYQV